MTVIYIGYMVRYNVESLLASKNQHLIRLFISLCNTPLQYALRQYYTVATQEIQH